jgi:hypothetical protein
MSPARIFMLLVPSSCHPNPHPRNRALFFWKTPVRTMALFEKKKSCTQGRISVPLSLLSPSLGL